MSDKFLSADEVRYAISRHLPSLDGLRGVAVLLVLIGHFAYVPIALKGMPGKIFALTHAGWTGVELFFVLSGFLITGILLDSKGAENYVSSFYIRRALRILPLYYGAVLVAFVLLPLLGRAGLPGLSPEFNPDQLWYWFYAGNWAWNWNHCYQPFAHFWSLAVEEQFYLAWPWIVWMTSTRTLAKLCIVMLVFAPLLRIFLFLRGNAPELIYPTTWSYLDILALGALAAVVVRNENWMKVVIPHLKKSFWLGFGGFLAIWLIGQDFGPFGAAFVYGVLPISVSFVSLLLVAVVTTGSSSIVQRILNLPWLQSYGKYSYAIYIFHPIVLGFLDSSFLIPFVGRFHSSTMRSWFYRQGALSLSVMGVLFAINLFADCLIMLGLGKLSWWAFEAPINGMKKRFKVRRDNPAPPPSFARRDSPGQSFN